MAAAAVVAVFAVALVAPLLAPATAQTRSQIDEAALAFERLDYVTARELLRTVVAAPERVTTHDLARAHLLLGVMDYSDNSIESASANFMSALQLDPAIRPDPQTVSPKIVEFFDGLRTRVNPDGGTEIRYVTLVDPRPAAAIRSMILPGWGQFHKGQRTKAVVLGSAWVAASGATAVAHGARRRARRAYVDEQDPARVVERYDTFNSRHKLRNTLAVTAAVVWVAAYIDALATPGTAVIGPIAFEVAPQPDGMTLAARVRF